MPWISSGREANDTGSDILVKSDPASECRVLVVVVVAVVKMKKKVVVGWLMEE